MMEMNNSGTFQPQEILKEPGLRLTPEEKKLILAKLPPADEDGNIYADAIFEGGGVRGIAFLGALRCCDDLGLRWRKLAGTSAGAITAAFLSSNFSVDQLEAELGNLDYGIFLTDKTSPFILNGDPKDDLRFPMQMVLSLAAVQKMGEYSSEPFKTWLETTLDKGNLRTFADVKKVTGKELKVVISNISQGEMLVLPDDLEQICTQSKCSFLELLNLDDPDQFSVAEAVRLSMSIPLFFEPGILGNDFIVDGGILSNFPLWIYDKQLDESNLQLPRWFTFGFRFIDRGIPQWINISEPFSLLSAIFNTMMSARDRYHQREVDRGRVVEIDVTEAKVTATDFYLPDSKKILLYRSGYQATKEFFLNPNLSWERHLISRGFGPLLKAQKKDNGF